MAGLCGVFLCDVFLSASSCQRNRLKGRATLQASKREPSCITNSPKLARRFPQTWIFFPHWNADEGCLLIHFRKVFRLSANPTWAKCSAATERSKFHVSIFARWQVAGPCAHARCLRRGLVARHPQAGSTTTERRGQQCVREDHLLQRPAV